MTSLSRWPAGIFRRSFVRAYASAFGLDVEETLAQFLGVFPEDGSAVRMRFPAIGSSHGLRLTLGESPGTHLDGRRLAGAAVDLLVVAATGLLTWLAGYPTLAAPLALATGALWHAAGALLWGTSPGVWLTRVRPPLAARDETATAEIDERA